MEHLHEVMEAKEAWTIWNLLDELQDRLWNCYEDQFMDFIDQQYSLEYQKESAEKP